MVGGKISKDMGGERREYENENQGNVSSCDGISKI